MNKPLVVIATPCHGGMVNHAYMNSVIRLMTSVSQTIPLSILLLGGDSLITRARALLVAKFLENPLATHLLFVDADISFEPEAFLRLYLQDKDFAAAMYPLKDIFWNSLPERAARGETAATAGLDYVGKLCSGEALKIENRFATAEFAGTGFQLVKRAVFEKLAAAHPELSFSSAHSRTALETANQYALFDPMIDPDTGEYLSEDFAFCRRWRNLGGEIWLDLDSRITHVGSADFRGNTSPRFLSA
ncbi:MAG: hypothetical protein HKL98_09580 [Burkholderiales bacterium]|nr:hypothetical protein [Burkholderiales bacterium]